MENLPLESHIDIFLYASDRDLPGLCSTSKYSQRICNDNRFWKKRTELNYGDLSLFKGSSTWKIFYRDISQKALYMFVAGEDTYLFNDIRLAYDQVL